MFVCTCSFGGPHGRLALPNELPSLNKDFHFTSLPALLRTWKKSWNSSLNMFEVEGNTDAKFMEIQFYLWQ